MATWRRRNRKTNVQMTAFHEGHKPPVTLIVNTKSKNACTIPPFVFQWILKTKLELLRPKYLSALLKEQNPNARGFSVRRNRIASNVSVWKMASEERVVFRMKSWTDELVDAEQRLRLCIYPACNKPSYIRFCQQETQQERMIFISTLLAKPYV